MNAGLIRSFDTEAFFDQSYTVFDGNSGVYKNKGTSLWNFFLNSRLRKFCDGISIVERAINLARERWTGRSERDKLDCRWSTKLINNTSELRRLTTVVYRRDRQALSTARFCRAGQLATADTWLLRPR